MSIYNFQGTIYETNLNKSMSLMHTSINNKQLVDIQWVSLSLKCATLSTSSKSSHSGIKCATATKKESEPNSGFLRRQQFSSRSFCFRHHTSSSLVWQCISVFIFFTLLSKSNFVFFSSSSPSSLTGIVLVAFSVSSNK